MGERVCRNWQFRRWNICLVYRSVSFGKYWRRSCRDNANLSDRRCRIFTLIPQSALNIIVHVLSARDERNFRLGENEKAKRKRKPVRKLRLRGVECSHGRTGWTNKYVSEYRTIEWRTRNNSNRSGRKRRECNPFGMDVKYDRRRDAIDCPVNETDSRGFVRGWSVEG